MVAVPLAPPRARRAARPRTVAASRTGGGPPAVGGGDGAAEPAPAVHKVTQTNGFISSLRAGPTDRGGTTTRPTQTTRVAGQVSFASSSTPPTTPALSPPLGLARTAAVAAAVGKGGGKRRRQKSARGPRGVAARAVDACVCRLPLRRLPPPPSWHRLAVRASHGAGRQNRAEVERASERGRWSEQVEGDGGAMRHTRATPGVARAL